MAADVFRRMSAGVHPGILAMPVNIVSRSRLLLYIVLTEKENPL